jgi:hypothetical protein
VSDYEGWQLGPEITCQERDEILRLPPEQGFAYRDEVHVYASRTDRSPGGLTTTDWGLRGDVEVPLVAEVVKTPNYGEDDGYCHHWCFERIYS